MEMPFNWGNAICTEDKRNILKKNIESEVADCLQKYGETTENVSINLMQSGPFSLSGQAIDGQGKAVVFITHSLLQDGTRSYRHWTIPAEAKP